MTTLARKYRRYNQPIRQHAYFTTICCLCVWFVLIYYNEIRYHIYLFTLNIQPYEHTITFWSTDYHISPIHDLKNLLIPLGVKFFDKSLSYSCQRTDTCISHLRILTQANGMNSDDEISKEFYEFYQNQIEMNVVDAFVCFHPSALCELYMPFNRSLIIIASTRYELSRFERFQWEKWNENLIRISQNPKNIIAANNVYDAQYIRYFTGINVTVLPSFCNYTNSFYNPKRPQFLLADTHEQNFTIFFRKLLQRSLNQSRHKNLQIYPIRELYPIYQYSDLTSHPAIIHVPYQVSVMSLFEQYRMNIPLFFPSLNLLTKWHYRYGIVSEKTWLQRFSGIRPGGSLIPGVFKDIPDPNNDRDYSSIRYWLNFSDFYQWPHIIYYKSPDDLIQKLTSTNFSLVSQKMDEYNQQVKRDLTHQWKNILNTIKKYSKKTIY